jgi:ribosome recycling factor
MAYDYAPFDKEIKETEEWLARELSGIRTGRATPAILDSIRVDSYGAKTPLNQLGSVTIEDARTLRVVFWDKSMNKPAETAILQADLGMSVLTDDQGLRVLFPELTAERRTMLSKLASDKVEQAKITLRGHRTETMKFIDASEKDGGVGIDELKRIKEEIQKRVDAATAVLEGMGKKKHEEISL